VKKEVARRVCCFASAIVVMSALGCVSKFSYKVGFVNPPKEIVRNYEGMSAGCVVTSVKFEYTLSKVKVPDNLPPPPPVFCVGLWHIEDNKDVQSSSLAFWGIFDPCIGSEHQIAWGEGRITRINSTTNAPADQGRFDLGLNFFEIEIGPLCPGHYVMKLYANEYDWSKAPSAKSGRISAQYSMDEAAAMKVVARKEVSVHYACRNSLRMANIYCLDSESNHTIFSGGAIAFDKPYEFVIYIRVLGGDNQLPDSVFGELWPQGKEPRRTVFLRWADGDGLCPNGIGQGQFAYRTDPSFKALDFWEFSTAEWHNKFIAVACSAQAIPNLINEGIGGIFYAAEGVILDRINDSTATFVPAKNGSMAFRLIYSPSIGIDSGSDVILNVINGQRELIYKENLQPAGCGFNGIEGFPLATPHKNMIYVRWDGRDNQTARTGHLADPELGPYGAWVDVDTHNDSTQQE